VAIAQPDRHAGQQHCPRTPIAFAALAGIYSERSGVVNIGIEGMMLMGAFISIIVASATQNLFLGVMGHPGRHVDGALHAVLSIKYKVNQIISGTVLIILGLGITSYLTRLLLDVYSNLNSPPSVIQSVQSWDVAHPGHRTIIFIRAR